MEKVEEITVHIILAYSIPGGEVNGEGDAPEHMYNAGVLLEAPDTRNVSEMAGVGDFEPPLTELSLEKRDWGYELHSEAGLVAIAVAVDSETGRALRESAQELE